MEIRKPDEDEVIGVVVDALGGKRFNVKCNDGEERLVRIPGSLEDVWVEKDDIILVTPWEWQDEKGDLRYKYSGDEIEELKEKGEIDLED